MNGVSLALVIILAILLFILLLLLIPLRLKIRYNGEETSAVFKYFLFSIRLYPKKDGGKNKKKENKKEKEKPYSEFQKKSKAPFTQQVSTLISLVTSSGRLAKIALSLHNLKFTVTAKVCSEDAAQTAVNCGKTSAFLHSAAAVLGNFIEIKKRNIAVLPDYEGSESVYNLDAVLSLLPIRLVFNIHKLIPELIAISDALPNKNKGEKTK